MFMNTFRLISVTSVLLSGIVAGVRAEIPPNVHISAPSPLMQNEEQIFYCPDDSNIVVANWRDLSTLLLRGGIGRSTDGGATWTTFLNPLAIGANSRQSDPTMAVDGDGNFYMSFLDFVQELVSEDSSFIVFIKSTDKGETWTGPYPVCTTCGQYFEDKQMITVDRTGGPYDGNVYVAWSRYPPLTGPLIPRVMFSRSIDGGMTFEDTIVIGPPRPNPPCEHPKSGGHFAQPMVGPDGTVYVFWSARRYDGCEQINEFEVMFMSKSTDGGQTWPETGTEIFWFNSVSLVDGDINVYNTPSGSVDISDGPYTGNIYISTINGVHDGDLYHSDAIVLKSTDGGDTWFPPVRVNDDPPGQDVDQFHPWLVINEDGVIAVIFYDQRTYIQHYRFDAYAAYSFDGAETFTANHRISGISINPDNLKRRGERAGKIAEYIGITLLHNNVNAIWTDTRNGNQDVYGAYFTLPFLNPRLYSVADGSYIGPEPDSLVWSTCWHEGDVSYRVEMDEDSLFSSPELSLTVGDNKLHSGSFGVGDGVYFWRVKAFRVSESDSTDYSDAWLFALDTEAPPMPTPVSPSAGILVVDSTPTFTWSVDRVGAVAPEYFELEISVDPLFSGESPYFSYDSLSEMAFEMPDTLTIDTVYNWRVNHYDLAGNESGCSEVATFRFAFTYVCGDADASDAVDIDDAVYLITYIFAGGIPPQPLESGDADCSGAADIDDVVYLIEYIFSGGNEPCDTDGDGTPDC